MQRINSRTPLSRVAACLALGLGDCTLVACGEHPALAADDGAGGESSVSGGPGLPEAEASGAAGSGSSDDGYLVVITERESPEVNLQYLSVLEEWPASGEIDYDTAVELGEFVSVYALGRAVFVYQPDDAIVRRLVVKPGGIITEDETMSFAAHGVSGFAPPDMVYVSSNRAYLLDEVAAQLVVWDPSAMKVLGSVTIGDEVLARGDLREGAAAPVHGTLGSGPPGPVSDRGQLRRFSRQNTGL